MVSRNTSYFPKPLDGRLLRKTLFWLHLTTAVCSAVIIVIMAATGALLTYERQIVSWLDVRRLDGSPPVAGAPALPASEIVARARAAAKGNPSAVRWRAGTNAPVEVMFGGGHRVFANAFSGEVLGTGARNARMFFGTATRLHTSLAVPRKFWKVGLAIATAANLALLLLLLSGSVLWWPRRWNVSAFRNVLLFRRGLRSKARDFNWHNVIGVWSLVPLFIIVVSGVLISSPRFGAIIDRVVSATTPAAPRSAVPAREPRPAPTMAELDALIARAKQQDPEWRLLTLQLQPTPRGGILFTLDRSPGNQPQKRAELVLASNGEVMRWQPFATQSSSRKVRSVLRFAHTGEVLGVAGQTIAGLASAAGVVLAYTGIALALRRWLAWRRRRKDGARSANRDTRKRRALTV